MVEYPISVSQDGAVFPMDGCECFPDTQAAIQGAKSAHLPNKITT